MENTMERLRRELGAYFCPGVKRRRLIMALLGVLVCAFGVSLCRMADFGVDPFQTLCSGLYCVIPLPEGLTYIGINALLLLAVLLLDRHYIGLGTLLNLFLFGYVVDFCQRGLTAAFGQPDMLGRVVYMVLGIGVICVSCALYITADLGVSTYDAISLHLADRKLGPYRLLRIGTDLVCVVTGFLLGATVGVCTLITAFLLGPAIAFFRERCFEPLLKVDGAASPPITK